MRELAANIIRVAAEPKGGNSFLIELKPKYAATADNCIGGAVENVEWASLSAFLNTRLGCQSPAASSGAFAVGLDSRRRVAHSARAHNLLCHMSRSLTEGGNTDAADLGTSALSKNVSTNVRYSKQAPGHLLKDSKHLAETEPAYYT
jgi:hypothetical protein